MKLLLILLGSTIAGAIVLLAGVGAIFLLSTTTTPIVTNTCDVVKRVEHGYLCEAYMSTPDEVTIMRKEEQ